VRAMYDLVLMFNVGFSGRSLEFRFASIVTLRSGEIATPMVSGLMLDLENIYGLEVSIRGGICGAFLPHVPLANFADFAYFVSVGPRKPLYSPGVLGSSWKGNISLSRDVFRRRRKQMNRIINPARIAAPPALPTDIATILFFVNVGVDPAFSAAEASAEGVAVLMSEALTGDNVEVASVVDGDVCELLVLLEVLLDVLLDLLEVPELVVAVVDKGAKRTMLGISVWMTTFAVIVR
jgi:hypothetical protein